MKAGPSSLPSENKSRIEGFLGNKDPSPPTPAFLPSLPPCVTLELGAFSTSLLLHSQAIPHHLTGAVIRGLAQVSASAKPDVSPIRWKARLQLPHGRGSHRVVDTLCDNGAHGEFLSLDEAERLGVKLIPLENPTSARLVEGTLLPITH